MNNRFLAVIPARGGSKRLSNKNIQLLGGKPLVAWTIEAANNAQVFDEIIVSTDSFKIAEIAQFYGAKIPFMRPEELAKDETTSVEVLLHTLKHYQSLGYSFDYVALLQPTSPFRTGAMINEAISLLQKQEADAIISVCECEHNPLWTNTLPDDHSLRDFLNPVYINKRSQDLPIYYRLNGAIYLCKVERVLSEKKLLIDDRIYAYIMSQEDSIDIDTPLDFLFAQLILQQKGL